MEGGDPAGVDPQPQAAEGKNEPEQQSKGLEIQIASDLHIEFFQVGVLCFHCLTPLKNPHIPVYWQVSLEEAERNRHLHEYEWADS